jgi:patched domain-containing protein
LKQFFGFIFFYFILRFFSSQLWLFPANPFSLDVNFNKDNSKIIASRFLIQAINISDTNHEKVMVKDLRAICKNAKINATVFHPYFVFFDQFELVRPMAIQAMIVGALIMMIISFIFIPNFLCSLWVAFSIVSIELGVAGYMSLWDVNLDSISMINLIMCIGFSVDFTAHICYTYMSSKAKTPDERVRESLYSLGLPIVQGAFSTILGVVALLLAESYIFLVFFKMVFLVIFFGAMHGLLLLPVLLSLFGPGSCTPVLDDDDHKAAMVAGKKHPHPYAITHPQLGLSAGFGSKTFLNGPFKTFGTDEKDLGIGTSGEDSSESSSSKSQRRQAIEDANTRRRYEEGWRRSSHNLSNSSPSQFQPVIDLYGQESERIWNGTTHESRPYRYEDDLPVVVPSRKPAAGYEMEGDRWKQHTDTRKRRTENESPRLYADDEPVVSNRYYYNDHPHPQPQTPNARKYSDESTQRHRTSDDRSRARKYTPPEGIYKQNPNRSSSQHNLYYPRPQRSSSQHSLHQLRHMGDMRFP